MEWIPVQKRPGMTDKNGSLVIWFAGCLVLSFTRHPLPKTRNPILYNYTTEPILSRHAQAKRQYLWG